MIKKIKFAPLNGAFMATSIIGLLISLMYVIKISLTWGVTFAMFFGIMFIASVVSMTVADPDTFVEMEKKKKRS